MTRTKTSNKLQELLSLAAGVAAVEMIIDWNQAENAVRKAHRNSGFKDAGHIECLASTIGSLRPAAANNLQVAYSTGGAALFLRLLCREMTADLRKLSSGGSRARHAVARRLNAEMIDAVEASDAELLDAGAESAEGHRVWAAVNNYEELFDTDAVAIDDTEVFDLVTGLTLPPRVAEFAELIASGYNQKDCAELLGVGTTTLQRWQRQIAVALTGRS